MTSFIKDVMLKDVGHVDIFLKMRDVHVSFGISIHYFVQRPSYFLWCTHLSSTFIESLSFFEFSFFQMFGRLLGLKSFDSLEGLLTCKQASFLITFGGIKFIPTTTITPMAYLGNWALMASIIVVKFMVDQRPFLLKTITWLNNNTFPFQKHFKATCDYLPPPVRTCFPLEHFIKQQMVQLQDSILKHLHHHTVSNILFDKIFQTHCAQI